MAKKGGKYLTLLGKISFSVILDLAQFHGTLVFIERLFYFLHFFFCISNFLDLSITEET
jgi:hypothetical protein